VYVLHRHNIDVIVSVRPVPHIHVIVSVRAVPHINVISVTLSD